MTLRFSRLDLGILLLDDLLEIGHEQDVVLTFHASWRGQSFPGDLGNGSAQPQLNLLDIIFNHFSVIVGRGLRCENALLDSLIDIC